MLQINPKFAPLVEIQEELDKLSTAWFNTPIGEDVYEYRNMLEDKILIEEAKWTQEFNQLSEEDQDFWWRYFEKPETLPYDAA
jgi:hypothetical protein